MNKEQIKQINKIYKNKKAFIFDFDGTIMNTELYYWKSLGKILRDNGMQLSKSDIDNYIGKTNMEITEHLSKDNNISISTAEKIMYKANQHYEAETEGKIKPFSYFNDILRDHSDKKMYILSSSDEHRIIRELSKHGLLNRFENIISVHTHKVPKHKALSNTQKYFNCTCEDSLVFEDSERVLRIARDNNINSVGIEHLYNKNTIKTYDIKIKGI